MKLFLCPRCELNYITEKERYCKVCLEEMHGTDSEEEEMCSICKENPVKEGYDVCEVCLKEMGGSLGTRGTDDEEANIGSESTGIGNMESTATMDEFIPEVEEENTAEYRQMEDSMSVDELREEEEKQEEDEEQDDED